MQLVTIPLKTRTGAELTHLNTTDTLWENTPPFWGPIVTCTVAYIASSAFRERDPPLAITYGTYFTYLIHLGPSVRPGGDENSGLVERFSESTDALFFPGMWQAEALGYRIKGVAPKCSL